MRKLFLDDLTLSFDASRLTDYPLDRIFITT